MILIKNIDVYAPAALGIQDVLIAGGQIETIGSQLQAPERTIVIDGTDKCLTPGFIDQHVHITGGGGEGGIVTRVPELNVNALIDSGITTVVGLLGTDGITRQISDLLVHTKRIRKQGLTAYALTGSYAFPSVTFTGSVQKDLVYLEEIIGCKIAISDHRAPYLEAKDLARLAIETRVGGMISGKAGILTLHVGNGPAYLKPLWDCVEEYQVPISVLRPTHVNRNSNLFKDAVAFMHAGGYIDLSCGLKEELRAAHLIQNLLETETLDRVTISSDGNGSYSRYDSAGNLTEIGAIPVALLLEEFQYMVKMCGLPIETALKFFTINVSKALKLDQKGIIQEGADADALIFDKNLVLETVIANGKIMRGALCESNTLNVMF